MYSLQQDFAQVAVGPCATYRNLTLFPLLRPERDEAEPGYLLVEDAISQGVAQITELANGGSVPELRFENNSPHAVLLLDGEELLGAQQNRVFNLTILAPPHKVTVIPVTCVEGGRWRMQSAAFRPASHVMYAAARAARTSQVTCAMRANGTRRSDQSAIWRNIAAKASRMQADSPTQAMSAIYDQHAITIEEYARAFDCEGGQAGVVFAIDGRVVGLDLFDHPQTLQRLIPKLVRSYALDALESAAAALPRGCASMKGVLGHRHRHHLHAAGGRARTGCQDQRKAHVWQCAVGSRSLYPHLRVCHARRRPPRHNPHARQSTHATPSRVSRTVWALRDRTLGSRNLPVARRIRIGPRE